MHVVNLRVSVIPSLPLLPIVLSSVDLESVFSGVALGSVDLESCAIACVHFGSCGCLELAQGTQGVR